MSLALLKPLLIMDGIKITGILDGPDYACDVESMARPHKSLTLRRAIATFRSDLQSRPSTLHST